MSKIVSTDEYKKRIQYLHDTYSENLSKLFGISTPHGWLSSIENMFSHLEVVFGKEKADQVLFLDLKEKYAAATFRWGHAKKHNIPHSNLVHKIVDRYEDCASTKCQVCGAPGTVRRKGGYLVRLCVSHFDVF